jgi:osmoprotectant transport system substrate-binding protein
MADALMNNTVDVAELCSTQPDIIVNGWVVLADDLHTQPADNMAPIVRNDYLAKLSASDKNAFEKVLNDVSALIDTATLADLYKQVDVDHKDLAVVAKAWLQAKGFVPAAS